MAATKLKQRIGKPLDVFTDPIAEVLAVSRTRAFVLDEQGRVRFAEHGEERPSPIEFSMPGMALIVATPLVHRKLDAIEASHTTAAQLEISAVVKREGPARERAMFWKGAGVAYHDFARYGRVVVWRYGMHNAFNEKRRLCRAADEQGAIDLLADIRDRPPAGYRATSPFYVEKRGCVIRTYANGPRRDLRGVVGREWRSFGGTVLKSFASAEAAEAAYEVWEHRRLASGWGAFGIELDRSPARRR